MISESGLIEFYVYMYVLCREFYELHKNFDSLGHPDLGMGRPYVPLGQVKGIRTSGSNYNKILSSTE